MFKVTNSTGIKSYIFKGNEFEEKVCYKLILLDMGVNKSKETNQGDNGIDIIVSYKDYTFLVQCKNYDEDNANHGNAVRDNIMKFESAMSWYPQISFGVFVVEPARSRSCGSPYKILLTDYKNICEDVMKFIQNLESSKDLNKVIKSVEDLNKLILKNSITLAEIKKNNSKTSKRID
ncbi:hypothetical protein F8M41_009203 [Gigaspora margarita]|uniref:Restriction endonuclease type IV Mrr domain-containing protein n=1 Tax=Gigaspora margarita TaxID=4874 RepID=A0A8H4AV74_GIGMA|nr:hypothetical protein F8M41_009203 [Gigaspora margarita]